MTFNDFSQSCPILMQCLPCMMCALWPQSRGGPPMPEHRHHMEEPGMHPKVSQWWIVQSSISKLLQLLICLVCVCLWSLQRVGLQDFFCDYWYTTYLFRCYGSNFPTEIFCIPWHKFIDLDASWTLWTIFFAISIPILKKIGVSATWSSKKILGEGPSSPLPCPLLGWK